MYKIEVFGEASNKIVKTLEVKESDFELTLMEFLQENGTPVASTCLGEGMCQKCVINKNTLSCTVTVGFFCKNNALEDGTVQVIISYL